MTIYLKRYFRQKLRMILIIYLRVLISLSRLLAILPSAGDAVLLHVFLINIAVGVFWACQQRREANITQSVMQRVPDFATALCCVIKYGERQES